MAWHVPHVPQENTKTLLESEHADLAAFGHIHSMWRLRVPTALNLLTRYRTVRCLRHAPASLGTRALTVQSVLLVKLAHGNLLLGLWHAHRVLQGLYLHQQAYLPVLVR